MNSREKGKRGERQWRDELRANGFAARRGQQFSGGAESPDVICEALAQFHFEVKAGGRLNIEEAMEQARRDCRNFEIRNTKSEHLPGHHANCEDSRSTSPQALSPNGEGSGQRGQKVPIVAHRRSFRSWLVTMEAETFFRMLRGDFFNHGCTRMDTDSPDEEKTKKATAEDAEHAECFTKGNEGNAGAVGTDGTSGGRP